MANNNSKIASNTLFLGIRMIVVMLISIYTTRLLLHGLGVVDYGIYNVTIGVISLCSFLRQTMANGMQRFYNYEIGEKNDEKANLVFNTGLRIQILLVIIIVIICETLGLWYVNNHMVVGPDRLHAALIVFHVSVLAFSMTMLEVPFLASIMAHERMHFFAIVSICDAILKLAIAYCIQFVPSDHLVSYSILLVLVNCLNLILYVTYSKNKFKEIRIRSSFSYEMFRPMFVFSGWNLLEKVARIGKDQGVNLMLNFYFGPIANASRGIVNQVSAAFSNLIDTTMVASRPRAIQSYAEGKKEETIKIMFALSKFSLVFMYLLVYPTSLEASYILHMWLGNDIPSFTLPFLYVTLLTIVIDKLSTPVNIVVHASGKMKMFNILSGILNIVVLPIALWMLISGKTPVDVYWLVFFCTIINQMSFVFALKRIVDYSVVDYIKTVIVPGFFVFLTSFIFPFSIRCIMEESFVRLFCTFSLTFIFGGISIYFVGLNRSEKNMVKNIFKKNRKIW